MNAGVGVVVKVFTHQSRSRLVLSRVIPGSKCYADCFVCWSATSHPQYPLFLASASRGSPDDEEEDLYLPECEYAEGELENEDDLCLPECEYAEEELEDEEDEMRGWLWMMTLEEDEDEEL